MNILIIDDHQIMEDGIKNRLLKIIPKVTCYFADNIRTGLAIAQQNEIDLIICDLEFKNNPEHDGFYFIEKLLSFEPRTKAIAYTNYNSYRVMKKATRHGFLSFLDKGCNFKAFEETVINVLKYGAYTSATMRSLLKKRNKFTRSIFSDSLYGISDLSNRELELTILAKETTDRKKLAVKMEKSPYTIDSYFKNIVDKLHLKHRQDVAFFSKEFQDELLKIRDQFS